MTRLSVLTTISVSHTAEEGGGREEKHWASGSGSLPDGQWFLMLRAEMERKTS